MTSGNTPGQVAEFCQICHIFHPAGGPCPSPRPARIGPKNFLPPEWPLTEARRVLLADQAIRRWLAGDRDDALTPDTEIISPR
jgi:hypothetical protein